MENHTRPLRHSGSQRRWRSPRHDLLVGVAIYHDHVRTIAARLARHLADAERCDRDRASASARAAQATADGAGPLSVDLGEASAAIAADAADMSRQLAADLADAEPIAREHYCRAVERMRALRPRAARADRSARTCARQPRSCRSRRARRSHRTVAKSTAGGDSGDPEPEPPGDRRHPSSGVTL